MTHVDTGSTHSTNDATQVTGDSHKTNGRVQPRPIRPAKPSKTTAGAPHVAKPA
jgi:hypothetical protein